VILLVNLVIAVDYYEYDPEDPFAKSIEQFAEQSGLDVKPYIRQPDGAKILRYYKDGNEINEIIPEGYNIGFKDNALVFSGSSGENLEVLGFYVNSIKPIELKISSQKGIKQIELIKGTADITIETIEGYQPFGRIRGTSRHISPGIPVQYENAVIKIDKDNNIIFARFNSVNRGSFTFKNKGKNYRFYVRENSDILFDPENGIIKGDGANLDISAEGLTEHPGYNFRGKYSLNFDKDGNLVKVETNGRFEIKDQSFSTSRESLTVVFDRDEFNKLRESTENIVLLDRKEILMKGFVDVESLDDSTLYYHGRKDSFTAFDREKDKFFVKEGDALFGNREYEIEIKDGESFFKKKKYLGAKGSTTHFSFEHENLGGVLETGIIDGRGMRLEIVKDGQVFFDENIENKVKRGTSRTEIVLGEMHKNSLIAKSRGYEKRLSNLREESPEWYNLYLEKLKNDEQLGFANGEKIVSRDIFSDVKGKIGELENKLERDSKNTQYKILLAQYYKHAGDIVINDMSNSKIRHIEMVEVNEDGERVKRHIVFSGDLSKKLAVGEYKQIEGKEFLDLEYGSHFGDNDKTLGKYFDALEYYKKARDLGIYSPEEFKLKEIDAAIAGGNYFEATKRARELIKSNPSDLKLKSQAYSKLGASLFYSNADLIEAQNAMRVAIGLDPHNAGALRIKNSFDHAQLSAIRGIASSGPRQSMNELKVLTGDLGGSNWQWLADVGTIVGSPWTTSHVTGSFDEYLDRAGSNIDRAQLVGLAGEQMSLLVENGISIEDYRRGEIYDLEGLNEDRFSNKFLAVYSSNGYDDLIPVETMADIFSSEKYQTASQSERKDVMLNLMRNKGYNINNPELQRRFFDTQKQMALIQTLTDGQKKDGTLSSLMYPIGFVPPSRIGDAVEIDPTKYVGLYAKDILLNPLNLVGAGFAAKGASIPVREGLKLSLKQGLRSGLKNTIKAWGSISGNQLARAYATEIAIDATISLGLEGLAGIDPDLAKTIGLGAGILGVSTVAGGTIKQLADTKGVKVFSDLSGSDFFVKSADDLNNFKAIHGGDIFGEAGEKFLISKIDGKDVKIALRNNFENLYETNLLNRLHVLGNSALVRDNQKTLEDIVSGNKNSGETSLEPGPGRFAEVESKITTEGNALHYQNKEGTAVPLAPLDEIPEFSVNGMIDHLGKEYHANKKTLDLVAENVRHVSSEELVHNLQKSAKNLDEILEGDSYILVLNNPGRSHQWAYELALDKMGRKPEDILVISSSKQSDSMIKKLEEGQRNFVIFDDISYSGTQLTTTEFGEFIPSIAEKWRQDSQGHRSIAEINGDPINYFAVTAFATDIAQNGFKQLNTKYIDSGIHSHLLRGERILNINDLLTLKQLDELQLSGIQLMPAQTLVYHSAKVPDSLSLPRFISENIYIRGTDTPYFQKLNKNTIYNREGSNFRKRWDNRIKSPESYLEKSRLEIEFEKAFLDQ
jgi:hypothetical protein